MNKIEIENDSLKNINIDSNIKVEYFKSENIFGINQIDIFMNNNSKLLLDINVNIETKLNINFNIVDNSKCDLYIVSHGNKAKIQYLFNISGTLNLIKYNTIETLKEMFICHLNKENSIINYNCMSKCIKKEVLDCHMFHDCSNTISNISIKSIVNCGSYIHQLSVFIPSSIHECKSNVISNFKNNDALTLSFRPNFYVDNDNSICNITSSFVDDINLTEGITSKEIFEYL